MPARGWRGGVAMERVMIVEDHSAFAQALELVLGQADGTEVVEEIEASGGEASIVGGDVSEADEVGRIVGEIEDRYGRLDVLVNNAGSLIERRTLAEMTDDLWDRIMDVNL